MGGCMCMFNDWTSSTGPNCADNYNYFQFKLKGGGWFNRKQEAWEFYLYGDETMKILRDGTEIMPRGKPTSMGSAGFGTSPNEPTNKHTTYELCLPSEKGMTMTMNIADPVSKGSYDAASGSCVADPPTPEPTIC